MVSNYPRGSLFDHRIIHVFVFSALDGDDDNSENEDNSEVDISAIEELAQFKVRQKRDQIFDK